MSDSMPLGLMQIISAARRAVPAVDYALGAAGVAAAGALIVGLIGNGRAAIIILGGTFVAMLLLLAFAHLLKEKGKSVSLAGNVILWSVTVFFCGFLALTGTAFMFQWPSPWLSVLGISYSPAVPTASRSLVLGKWRAYQDQGDLKMESIIQYRDDGTCEANLTTILKGEARTAQPTFCSWKFERISNSEFRLTVSYPDHPNYGGTSEYEIISRDRIRHTKGLGGDYTAERLK